MRTARIGIAWWIIRRSVVLIVTGGLLLSITSCGGGPSAGTASPRNETPTADAASQAKSQSDARIAFLEARAADDPLDVFSLNELAVEHLQRARETGDVSWLSRAATALQQSLERRPNDNYEALALSASVSVTQHDFGRGLELAQQAIALKPTNAYGFGALGDADMGLGRYEGAAMAYGRMHELEPSLSSFGRLALLAQVEGRIDDARSNWGEALTLAHGDGTPEHEAWVRAQTANLYFNTGDLDGAAAQYQQALDVFPNYVHALAGLGRVAAARGDLREAADKYEAAVERVTLPEYVIALDDVYEASGDNGRASDQYELVGAIEQLYSANGVNLDLQIALFNADHERDLAMTADRARALFQAQPSIAAADALAWVLYKNGDIDGAQTSIKSALRTCSREPMILFHAGMIDLAAGDAASARSHLQDVHDTNPHFSVRYAPEAERALESLDLEASR